MFWKTGLLLSILFLLPSCAFQRASEAEEAKQRLVGFSKDQIFACMGLPTRRGTQGDMEIWAYRSGDNRTDKRKASASHNISSLSATLGLSDEVKVSSYCVVQVLMKEDRVMAVRYNGPTGGFLTEDEQCAYAVRNCLNEPPDP